MSNVPFSDILPLEDLEVIKAIEDTFDLEDAKKVLAEVKNHGTTSWEEAKKKLKLRNSKSSRSFC